MNAWRGRSRPLPSAWGAAPSGVPVPTCRYTLQSTMFGGLVCPRCGWEASTHGGGGQMGLAFGPEEAASSYRIGREGEAIDCKKEEDV